ncbi:uncharacterized protein LOC132733884 [Ruditapes philippinarum]|uniref:uncharacterized protein LOC132733884 n=1 Tax=Ruditapes philippinarum TaxID=129788 RepID=UPI00295A8C58|nr:uncharacterized protein LOC132733884 [Ruditapes philippinarum]
MDGADLFVSQTPKTIVENDEPDIYADFPIQDNAVKGDIDPESKEIKTCFVDENVECTENITKSPKKSAGKILNTVVESPLPRRKKKRRKEKNIDTQSITSVTSIVGVPPRPPPRLAPIAAIKSLVSGPVRPGSSCSSQVSFTDSNIDGRQSVLSCDSCGDITKSDAMSFDNLSVSSLSTRKNKKSGKFKQNLLHENFSNNLLTDKDLLSLDCKREIKSVPEEVLTPSDCKFEDRVSDIHKLYPVESGIQTTQTGIVNTGYEQCSDDDVTKVMQDEVRVRNNEARRKRREKQQFTEKLSPTALLNEGNGYQRLVPDTP